MRFHSSTFSASSGESGITPALLMITSTRPKRCSAKSTKAWVSSRLVTSSARQAATPPRSPISATSFSSRSRRRAPSTTVAPWAASRRAVASPMPLLAPVMSTILPVMFDMGLSSAGGFGRRR